MVDPWEERFTTEVNVVYGPPMAGKTTYVKAHAKRGDLIVDVDWIWAALTGQPLYDKPDELIPFVLAARDAVFQRLMSPSKVGRAWLITSKPEAAQQLVSRLGAKRIDLSLSNDESVTRNKRRTVENKWAGFLNS